MFKKICTSVVVGLLFFNVAFAQNSTVTVASLQELVAQLQKQVLLLQTQLNELKSQFSTTQTELAEVKAELKLTRTLRQGVIGDDVKQLQEFLKQFKDIYPEGLVTGYFGPLTEKAVQKWQEKQGIVGSGDATSTGYGQVGPRTIAKINELITEGAGQSGVIPPGLLIAPGIQKKLEGATTTPPVGSTTTPPTATTTLSVATSTATSTTSTISGQATTTTYYQSPADGGGGGSGSGGTGGGTMTGSGSTTTTTTTATSTTTTSASCNSVDFENPPHVAFRLTWNSDYSVEDAYNSNLDSIARAWLSSQGLEITGSPNGFVHGTSMSGGAGQSGVVVGFASPDFSEQDDGLSDNEMLTITLFNELPGTVTLTVASTPSSMSIINNQSSTVVMDTFDSAGNLLGSATKTFIGVTNSAYTPSTVSVSAAQTNIKKITLKATQHPYGGVWVEKITCGSGTTAGSGSTATTTAPDTTPPSTPTNLSASAISTSQINLSWSDSTDDTGVIGYKIYRGGTQLAATTTLSYSDLGLQASTTYTYTVAAYDAAGNNSAQSVSASATTQSPPPPVSTLPDAPTITSITPYTPIALNQYFISSITLQWNAVTNPTSYPTYYRAWRRLGGGDWLFFAQTQQTTFFDLNIGRGTYYYHVNACSTGTPTASYGVITSNCGPDSNIMTATLAGGGGTSDTTPPSTPTGLTAWPDPYNRNFLSWTVSTDNVGVAGYNIYRNGTYLKSVCCVPAEDDFLFSSSTTYTYTVAAYDAAGNESGQSNSVSPAPLSLGAPPSSNNMASSLANVLESLQSLTAILQKLQGLFR